MPLWKQLTKHVSAQAARLISTSSDEFLHETVGQFLDLLQRFDPADTTIQRRAREAGPLVPWRGDTGSVAPARRASARVAVLYNYPASGHGSMARNIAAYLASAGIDVSMSEVNTELGPFFNTFFPDMWPTFSDFGFDFVRVLCFDRLYNGGRLLGQINKLGDRFVPKSFIQGLENGHTVVTCEPFASQFLSYMKHTRSLSCRHFAVHGDFLVNTHLFPSLYDGYVVPHRTVRQTLVDLGEPDQKVFALGAPISLAYERSVSKRSPPRVLVMGGGRGFLDLESIILAAEEQVLPECDIVCVCGTNSVAYGAITRRQATLRHSVVAHGYIANTAQLIRESSVIVSKPGGLSTSEALAAGTVPVFCLTTYGGEREEHNARFCVDIGFGEIAGSVGEIWRIVARLLRDPNELAGRRERGLRESAPNATRRLGELLISVLDN